MGYRDLRSFNRALFAKQAWCLWKMPNSLTAQIMEAKYLQGWEFFGVLAWLSSILCMAKYTQFTKFIKRGFNLANRKCDKSAHIEG